MGQAMSGTQRLIDFAADVATGAIKVVGLTQTLSEDTPILVTAAAKAV